LRSLLWTLFILSAWAQPANLVAGTTGKAPLWPLFAWSAWALTATVVAGTKVEGAALASVLSVCVVSGSLCGGGTTD
jgi:hypothetical protein